MHITLKRTNNDLKQIKFDSQCLSGREWKVRHRENAHSIDAPNCSCSS